MKRALLALTFLLPVLGGCQTISINPAQVPQVSSADFQNMVRTACGLVISLSAANALLATLDPRIEVASQIVTSLCHLSQQKAVTRILSGVRTLSFRGVTFQARVG